MVADFEEGQILGELQDLENEIEAVDASLFHVSTHKRMAALNRIIEKLKREKERLEQRLQIHRQKVKDSGIKH